MNFFKNKNLLQIFGVFLVALFFRLYRIDELMRFIWDEGRDMLAIRNIIASKDLTLFGPFNEIAGHIDFFGVFHYYLMLPSLWIAHFNPIGPAIFTALLGALSIPLSYLFIKKFSNHQIAILTSLFLSISPLTVKFTSWPWNPNTTGFFGILYLLTLQFYANQKKTTAVFFSSRIITWSTFPVALLHHCLSSCRHYNFFQSSSKKIYTRFYFYNRFYPSKFKFCYFRPHS